MTVFSSFWLGGYEGADHINGHGEALDMNTITDHLRRVREDYAALKRFNITSVRESVGWRLADKGDHYDFSSVIARMEAAAELDIQISWSLLHYGWPDGLALFSPDFVPRFARFCGALARLLAPWYRRPPVYSPVNEISFFSWGLEHGVFRCPDCAGLDDGLAIKRQLVRAALAGCDAIWQADSRARILHCDPLVHLVSADDSPASQAESLAQCNAQYQAWDMLAGRLEPELGGAPRYLDLVGANYYHSNQWECGTGRPLFWHLGDSRRRPLHQMLTELYQRYQRPLLLAETSHVGSGRGAWLHHITAQVAQAQLAATPLYGVCLYPVVDRPLWDDTAFWTHSGLWDLDREGPDPYARQLVSSCATALLQTQRTLRRFQSFILPEPRDKEKAMPQTTLIVFSHLRWGFVFQRPQHLLTRLASYYRVLFIEEPVYEAGPAGLRRSEPAANVTVIQPHTPIHASGFHDDQIALLQPLLAGLLDEKARPVVWFYTPMALPLHNIFTPAAVVYDCMDELSAFQQAPRQLQQRESALLSRADIVFTGGESLYEAKKHRHHNVHCFPSSVDAVHFEQALDRSNGHPLQQALAHPRLGYYGVIDERMDLPLIAALADSHPEWQIIMVGPVVKIDPDTLPQRANLHWLGQQPYEALPHFLAGWDVCLMPFALNAATRYISPTKVLEYMAAQLPIVSTAIHDVERHYSTLVAVAQDRQHFIDACEQMLALTDAQRASLAQQMQQVVQATSWDETARQMQTLIALAMENNARPSASTPAVTASTPAAGAVRRLKPGGDAADIIPCLIIGAGPTGLSAGYHYGEGAVVLEKNGTPGGWCRSLEDRGFTFDYAGHIMFSNDPYVLELYQLLLGDNLHWQMREAWVYSEGIYTRYPFQAALYGLPPAVIKECILGAIEARYGEAPSGNLARVEPLHAGKPRHDCCADGAVPDGETCPQDGQPAPAEDFESFIYRTWGRGIAKHFAIPYNKKLWTLPLSEMETSWLGGRVPLPDLAQIIEGALAPLAKPMGPNARFGYPLRGGFQALMLGFLPHLKCTLETNTALVKLLPAEHIAVLADGRRYCYDQLISTMPLPQLIAMLGDEAPEAVQAAAKKLRHVSIRCVNIGVGRANLTEKHWIYYPGDTLFHRIFVQGNASPFCNPEGGCGLTCEISYSPDKPLPLEGEALIARCIEECIAVGMINADDPIITANQVDIPYAYVVYDHARSENVALIRDWLLQQDILLSGRYSEWEYYNSDHAFLAGKRAAEYVKTRKQSQGTLA